MQQAQVSRHGGEVARCPSQAPAAHCRRWQAQPRKRLRAANPVRAARQQQQDQAERDSLTEEERRLFRKRTLKPSQMESLRKMGEEISVGTVCHTRCSTV